MLFRPIRVTDMGFSMNVIDSIGGKPPCICMRGLISKCVICIKDGSIRRMFFGYIACRIMFISSFITMKIDCLDLVVSFVVAMCGGVVLFLDLSTAVGVVVDHAAAHPSKVLVGKRISMDVIATSSHLPDGVG